MAARRGCWWSPLAAKSELCRAAIVLNVRHIDRVYVIGMVSWHESWNGNSDKTEISVVVAARLCGDNHQRGLHNAVEHTHVCLKNLWQFNCVVLVAHSFVNSKTTLWRRQPGSTLRVMHTITKKWCWNKWLPADNGVCSYSVEWYWHQCQLAWPLNKTSNYQRPKMEVASFALDIDEALLMTTPSSVVVK